MSNLAGVLGRPTERILRSGPRYQIVPGRGWGRRRGRFGRPPKKRILAAEPGPRGFMPSFPPVSDPLQAPPSKDTVIDMTADEYEAYRLTEYEGLGQEEAAKRMGISRGTLWRILQSAKKKLARMIVEGHQLQISGGHYVIGRAEPDKKEK